MRKISIGTSKTEQEISGRHDQRSLSQLSIPNTQDEFGLDNVRFNQALQNTMSGVDHQGKNGEYWRSRYYLRDVII